MKDAAVLAVAAFAVVKAALELLTWIGAEDRDAIYRKHLDAIVDSLDKNSLRELGRHVARRVVFRFRLAEVRFLTWPWLAVAAAALAFNYVCLLVSFADMARHNVNFDLEHVSLTRTAAILFRELGLTGSDQIVWMAMCNEV